jgi:hypothetical protein
MTCSNHQKQWLLALHNYHSVYESFSPHGVRIPGTVSGTDDFGPGVLPRVLPFIEAATVSQGFDYSQPVFQWGGINSYYDEIAGIRLKIMLCPSDPEAGKVSPSYTWGTGRSVGGSYCICRGSGVGKASQTDTYGSSGNTLTVNSDGVFGLNTFRALEHIGDGTSNTVALSEGLFGTHTGAYSTDASSRQAQFQRSFIGGHVSSELPQDVDAVAVSAAATTAYFRPDHCQSWLATRPSFATFNNRLTPNQSNSADIWGGYNATDGALCVLYIAARSCHPGGVVTANADASVHFVQNGIDRIVWANLGTTNNQITTITEVSPP